MDFAKIGISPEAHHYPHPRWRTTTPSNGFAAQLALRAPVTQHQAPLGPDVRCADSLVPRASGSASEHRQSLTSRRAVRTGGGPVSTGPVLQRPMLPRLVQEPS
jgi:hypothetical protein